MASVSPPRRQGTKKGVSKKIKNLKIQSIPSPGFPWEGASWILMVGLGLLGLWQFHNVEFYSGFDLVPGGRGDNRLVTALLEYFYHALRGESSFRSPAFY